MFSYFSTNIQSEHSNCVDAYIKFHIVYNYTTLVQNFYSAVECTVKNCMEL